MKKRTLTTVILSTLLLLIFCVSASALGESPKKAEIIKENQTITVSTKNEDESYYLKFVPTKTAAYELTVSDWQNEDFDVSINDEKGNYICGTEYNEYTEENLGTANLKANKIYYIEVDFWGEPAKVSISISKHKHVLKTTYFRKSLVGEGYAEDGRIDYECRRCYNYYKSVEIPYVNTVSAKPNKYVYDGKLKKPSITVINNDGNALQAGKDFTISGTTSAKNIGKYNIKLTFKGNYSGSRTLSWKIVPAAPKNVKVTKITTTSVTITWKNVKGVSGYIVSNDYWNKSAVLKENSIYIYQMPVGTAQTYYLYSYVKVKGKNILSDKVVIRTATKPYRIQDVKATGKNGFAKIAWDELYGVNGYQIAVSTSKNGKYKQVKNVLSDEAFYNRSVKIKKLKPGTYYFKIRAYVKSGKTVTYGNWSRPVAAKVK